MLMPIQTHQNMHSAVEAAQVLDNMQLVDSLEALMHGHMNLDSSNEILDSILNNL